MAWSKERARKNRLCHSISNEVSVKAKEKYVVIIKIRTGALVMRVGKLHL